MNDSDEAIRKAHEFADTAYADALKRSTKDLELQLAIQRNQLSARGVLRSGNMLHGTAQLYGKHIDDMVLAKVEGLLEGYELHGVLLDERLAALTIEDGMGLKNALLIDAGNTVSDVDRGGVFSPEQLVVQVTNSCKVSRESVMTIVERQRLKPKEQGSVSIVYQVSGYGRVNVNSTDNSVNVVTVSPDEIFTKLRHEITTHIPPGLQAELLQRVAALEAAQNSPSFAERYLDLISVAANHVTLLAPFLPALADMAHRIVK